MTDILDPDYKSDLTEEKHNRLALMCGHAVAPPLSPAARAVWEAAMNTPEDMPYEHDLAAALRAAAEQGETLYLDGCPVHAVTVSSLLAIARELEAQ